MRTLLVTAALAALLPATAGAFEVTGRFLYEDREWNKDGYTGTVQNLPIRHADVEVVDVLTQAVLAEGSTGVDGFYALPVSGQTLPVTFYVRCLADGARAGYHVRVTDASQRNLTTGELILAGASTHAIMTSVVPGHPPANDINMGTFLIQDTDGTGVAQAFNILDNGVDFWDWIAQADQLGHLPAAADFLVYGWAPASPNEGSNYSQQGILLSSPGQGNDTDGWSDTVILHETAHWFDDLFSRSDNPGGAHVLPDNNQNPRLSYGEGVATFHCAKVRKFRASRLNLAGDPIDDHVGIYGDLAIPPALPAAGALSFSYDFEIQGGILYAPGLPAVGIPVGHRGTAAETNITAAQWDLVDGTETPDETPGVDDDLVAVSDAYTWPIETGYLPGLPASNWVTVEDYYQGWFALHGPAFQKPGVDDIFLTQALMEFYEDAFEPDGALAQATPVTPVPHTVAEGRGVVINEIDLGGQDAVELYNGSPDPVDLTGWQLQVYVNNDTAPVVSRIYVFTPFTLQPGDIVTVFERGDPLDNTTYHLYAGTTPNAFNMSWAHGIDGACELRDATNAAVDFVRWRDAGGVDNTTPAPAGVGWAGLLDTPPSPPATLARDISGTDTDNASDFASQDPSLASANHPSRQSHTLFGAGDEDLLVFTAAAGTRYGFEARARYSASDPFLEVLSAGGGVLGSNDNMDGAVPDARLDFLAPTSGTYYLRVTHVGPYTDWAACDVAVFERPAAESSQAPSSVTAAAENSGDVADPVHVQWLNAAAYDSVRIYRDGAVLATLPGSPNQYDDTADRGVYEYEVSAFVGGTETARASTYEYAGIIECTAQDDFESGAADGWITEGSNWGVTPFAQQGLFAFTDSPAGPYQGCPTGTGGCAVNAIAVFRVPALMPPGSFLTWDQICITEHCEPTPCDVCIVEISTDEGVSWTELARYDQASDPGWADNVADPTDWRPASVDLSAYALETVVVRYRLQSDALLELDGWYIDNVRVNDETCGVAGAPTEILPPARLQFLPPAPNPMGATSRLTFVLQAGADDVEVAIHDVAGRLVRYERLGSHPAGRHSWTWNGTADSGVAVGSGVYFARIATATGAVTRKILRQAP